MHLRTHNLLELGQLRWKDGSDDVCAAFEGVTRTKMHAQRRGGASAGFAHSALSAALSCDFALCAALCSDSHNQSTTHV